MQFVDENTGENVRAVLENIQVSSESIKFVLQRVQENNEKFEQIIANAVTSSDDVSTLTSFMVEQRPAFETTIQNIQQTTQHVNDLVLSIDQEKVNMIVGNVNEIIASNSQTITDILHNLRQITDKVSAFSNITDEQQLTETLNLLHSTVKGGEEIIEHFNTLVAANTENFQQVITNTTDFQPISQKSLRRCIKIKKISRSC